MKLTTVKKLDQKNRLHVPYEYLKLADIEENDFVYVSYDDYRGEIIIKAAHLTPEAKEVFSADTRSK